ncbi:protein GrpE [Trichinella spiralis]|uniref:protein GrpE n=1 Tax=Trichinella spiralis TaxID=6334 RepID=UPI0001EFDC70|nr:protein GrpE [Trichinella spiralis]
MASIKGVLTMTVGHNRMDNQERGGWCLAENFDPNRPNPLISTQSSDKQHSLLKAVLRKIKYKEAEEEETFSFMVQ